MKKILILLLCGAFALPVMAQVKSVKNAETEKEQQATLQRLKTELEKSNAKLRKGDSEALAEIASIESCIAYVYIMAYEDYKSALPWVRSSIGRNAETSVGWLKRDIAQAYTMMALYHENGWAGVSKSDSLAFTWYVKAAQTGNSQGMYRLGLFYYEGWGTLKDSRKAFEWWLAAAENEERDAYCNVAIMYYLGDGVKRDFTRSAMWAEKGLEVGDAYCMQLLGIIYYKGEGVKRDYQKAFRLFESAAQHGETDAFEALAECYYYGRGVKRDHAEAEMWCRKGVDAGDEEAVKFMKKFTR